MPSQLLDVGRGDYFKREHERALGEALLQYEEQLSKLKKHQTVSVKLATLSGGRNG